MRWKRNRSRALGDAETAEFARDERGPRPAPAFRATRHPGKKKVQGILLSRISSGDAETRGAFGREGRARTLPEATTSAWSIFKVGGGGRWVGGGGGRTERSCARVEVAVNPEGKPSFRPGNADCTSSAVLKFRRRLARDYPPTRFGHSPPPVAFARDASDSEARRKTVAGAVGRARRRGRAVRARNRRDAERRRRSAASELVRAARIGDAREASWSARRRGPGKRPRTMPSHASDGAKTRHLFSFASLIQPPTPRPLDRPPRRARPSHAPRFLAQGHQPPVPLAQLARQRE